VSTHPDALKHAQQPVSKLRVQRKNSVALRDNDNPQDNEIYMTEGLKNRFFLSLGGDRRSQARLD
jgi:hypothetical protein